jgi:hypothetical protein
VHLCSGIVTIFGSIPRVEPLSGWHFCQEIDFD